eukprot:gene983-1067_t
MGDEEFYLHVNVVDGVDIHLSTAEDEFNESKKTLFATFLWTGSSLLAKELALTYRDLVHSASVLEFGAAAGLPSITAAKLGAKVVCASDYPSPCVIETLQRNVVHNEVRDIVHVVEHVWGESVERLLSVNGGEKFDLVVASECLWRHECHEAFIQSIRAVLRPQGTLLVTYSHHIPNLEEEDDRFFSRCEEVGLRLQERRVLEGKHMWSDKMVDIFLCRLSF